MLSWFQSLFSGSEPEQQLILTDEQVVYQTMDDLESKAHIYNKKADYLDKKEKKLIESAIKAWRKLPYCEQKQEKSNTVVLKYLRIRKKTIAQLDQIEA